MRSAIIHAKFCKISLVTQNGNNNILQHKTSLCWISEMALGIFLSLETFIFFPQTKTILLAGPGCSVDDTARIMPFSGK